MPVQCSGDGLERYTSGFMLYFPLFWQLRTALSAKCLKSAVNSEVLFNSTASSWITSLIICVNGNFFKLWDIGEPFTGWALLCYTMNSPNVCMEQYQHRNLSCGNLHIKTFWLSVEASWIKFPWIPISRIDSCPGTEQVKEDLLFRHVERG